MHDQEAQPEREADEFYDQFRSSTALGPDLPGAFGATFTLDTVRVG